MTYSEPLFNQVSRFVTSIGFGFVICVLYFLMLFLRKIVSDKRWAVITQDVLFGVIATVMSFFFMVLYNNGEVRWNLLFGETIGGLVLYFTVGSYVVKLLERFALVIRKTLTVLMLPLKLFLRAFPQFFAVTKIKYESRKEQRKARKKTKDESDSEKKKKEGKKILKKLNKKQKYYQNPLEKSE